METSKIRLSGRGKSACVNFVYAPENGPLFGKISVSGDIDLVRKINNLLAVRQPILSYMTQPFPVDTSYYQAYAAARVAANESGLKFDAENPPTYPKNPPTGRFANPDSRPSSRPSRESASARYMRSLSGREPNGRFVYTKGGAATPEPGKGPPFMRLLAEAIGIAYTEEAARKYKTDKAGLIAAVSALRGTLLDIIISKGLSAPARRSRDNITEISISDYASLLELYEVLREALPVILRCKLPYGNEYIGVAGEHLIAALSLLTQKGAFTRRALPEDAVLPPETLKLIAREIAAGGHAARATDAADAIERLIDLY